MTQDFPDLDPKEFQPLLPADVELQLRYLSRKIFAAQKENADIEKSYAQAKANLEVKMAKSRLKYAGESKTNGKNYTVDEREDHAIEDNEEAYLALAIEEAKVKASRGLINSLATQTDIVRSVSSSVKASMNL